MKTNGLLSTRGTLYLPRQSVVSLSYNLWSPFPCSHYSWHFPNRIQRYLFGLCVKVPWLRFTMGDTHQYICLWETFLGMTNIFLHKDFSFDLLCLCLFIVSIVTKACGWYFAHLIKNSKGRASRGLLASFSWFHSRIYRNFLLLVDTSERICNTKNEVAFINLERLPQIVQLDLLGGKHRRQLSQLREHRVRWNTTQPVINRLIRWTSMTHAEVAR